MTSSTSNALFCIDFSYNINYISHPIGLQKQSAPKLLFTRITPNRSIQATKAFVFRIGTKGLVAFFLP